MHLHGHRFVVVKLKSNSTTNTTYENYSNPVYKDTVAIPSTGFIVIRFRANNPGEIFSMDFLSFTFNMELCILSKCAIYIFNNSLTLKQMYRYRYVCFGWCGYFGQSDL